MTLIPISQDEVAAGRMEPAHLNAAVDALRTVGYVVLQDVIGLDPLQQLREKMLSDARVILDAKDKPFNFTHGHIQQDPPPFQPFLFREILMNEMVISVTREILGPGVANSYYSGNTNLPGSPEQPVHTDVGQLWPRMEKASPCFGIVVNVPVVAMDAENGVTELWPGSHLDPAQYIYDDSSRVPEDALEARRKHSPPVQPTVPLGSVVLRDIRLWHRGMPNRTQNLRPMIAMIHWSAWYGHQDPLKFPKDAEAFFDHPTLRTNAVFVDEITDYQHRNQPFDYQPEEQIELVKTSST